MRIKLNKLWYLIWYLLWYQANSRISINSYYVNNDDCDDKDGIDMKDKWVKEQETLVVERANFLSFRIRPSAHVSPLCSELAAVYCLIPLSCELPKDRQHNSVLGTTVTSEFSLNLNSW